METLRKSLDSRLLWALWITASVVPTALTLQGERPFPVHLLLIHLAAASTIQIIIYATTNPSNQHIYQSLSPSKQWQSINLSSLALSLLMVPILVFAYTAITFCNDVPNMILLLTLDWRPVDLFDKIIGRKLRLSDFARYFIFATGLYLISVCNFRLRFVPWLEAMMFLLFSGIAQLVSYGQISLNKPYVGPTTKKYLTLPQYWTLCSFAALGIATLIFPEKVHPDKSPLSMVAIVIASCSVVATCSLFVMGPTFQELEQDTQQSSLDEGHSTRIEDIDEDHSTRFEGTWLRFAIAGLVILSDSLLSPTPLNISIWQYIGYALASLAFLKGGLHGLTKPTHESSHGQGLMGRGTLVLLILAGGAWSYALLKPLTFTPVPLEYTNLPLNPPPSPASDLDIVISRYAEPVATVAETIKLFLALEPIRPLNSRVVIYNKNNDTLEFERDLGELLSHVNITYHTLTNVGREADAYFRHMVTNWDNLAQHTLFAQAELDEPRKLRKWINTFFIPETGFLQLSYEGRMCANCAHCGAWTDDPNVIQSLYSLTNPNKQCHDLVWVFRGQFIVSGQRIRANGKHVYEQLIQNLTDPNNAMHAPAYVGGYWHSAQKNSLNDPVFGFTIERFWGILMQCSELRVGQQSPSPLALSMRPQWLAGGFSHDVAQCLDRAIGES
jgi:hypothetical protein